MIDAFNAPFLQLRWRRSGTPPEGSLPWIEWKRGGRHVLLAPIGAVFFPVETREEHQGVTGANHALVEMWRHPRWKGRIIALRIALAPGERDVTFEMDSFFTVYDTRHPINNPIYILAAWNLFRWTGDLAFLREIMPRLRKALRHQQTEMKGFAALGIRNPWPGHDGLAGYVREEDGSKTFHLGHGIGNNYFDLLPFGGEDCYATSQYLAATRILARLERLIRDHPEWGVPREGPVQDPDRLEAHAARVREAANARFWNSETRRFAACIDTSGMMHDYGFTFLNLDSIWYGLAERSRAEAILAWLDGKRIVAGDTSRGEDIYRWRFGPRCTTRRNIDWYGQAWHGPETIPWGGQVQDGGAVLGFSFHDLWARLRVLGPDAAWRRLEGLLDWDREVRASGDYRAYYAVPGRGSLQGGGTPGGLGIDHEFLESCLPPSIVVLGFLGLDPDGTVLNVRPRLPAACPAMAARDLQVLGARIHILARDGEIRIELPEPPPRPLPVALPAGYRPRVGPGLDRAEPDPSGLRSARSVGVAGEDGTFTAGSRQTDRGAARYLLGSPGRFAFERSPSR